MTLTFFTSNKKQQLVVGLICFLVFQSTTTAQLFTKITTGAHVNDLAASRSVNWIDYDGDGDLDLFVSRGKQGGQNNMMYRNDGAPNYTFTKMDTMIISRDNEPSDGSSWGDMDNDGDPDLFVVNWYNRNNLMYRNNGNGNFTRITTGNASTDGGYSETCSWGDYNNDGLLDLYVSNSAGSLKNFLYKNIGNGQFQKIITGAIVNDVHHTRGVNWVDYDNDGDLDMYALNEENENDDLYKNMLTETGVDTFAKVTTGLLVTSGGSSWSGSWGDYDNDGDLDAFVTNNGFERNRLFRNDGGGNFDTVSAGTLTSEQDYFATASWIDYDNDGDLDLFVTTAYGGTQKCYLYKNELQESGLPNLTKVASEPLLNENGYWYGESWADFDNDGDLDVYIAGTLSENAKNIFYRNNGNGNNWLKLDCIGIATNKSAIGTKVKVKATMNGIPVWQMREIDGQSGYCGQTLQQHFGLGDATSIDSLVIDWFSGSQEVFVNVPVNQHFTIVENDSTPLVLASPEDGSMNDKINLTLKWYGTFWTAPYRLQVATDSTFASDVLHDISSVTDTAKAVSVLSNNSTYFWRVQSQRTIHPNIWSPVRKFSNVLVPPTAPSLVFPANNDSNRAIVLTMKWRRATNASKYHLRISVDSLFTSTVFDDSLVADTSKSVGSLSNKTKYFWQVRSGNVAGYSSFTSVYNYTTIVDTPSIPTPVYPTEGAVDIPQTILFKWNRVNDAQSYRLQIASDSLFTTLISDVQNIADTFWQSALPKGFTKYFWRVRASNIGGTSAYCGVKNFRTILSTPVLHLPSNNSHQLQSVQFDWLNDINAERFYFQIAEDSLFNNIVRSDTLLTDTTENITGLILGSRYFWRVRAERTESISEWSEVWWFDADVTTMNMRVNERWNIISLPLLSGDSRKVVLFPDASSSAFSFGSSGYVAEETLKNGVSYWLKFDSAQSVTMNGTLLNSTSVEIQEGWNLIGSLSHPLAVTEISSSPGGIVTSEFYEYKNGYTTTDTLFPGEGYWIKSSASGTLTLSSLDHGHLSFGKINIVPSKELPPPSPEGDGNGLKTQYSKPETFSLEQNYPNPFNPTTVIRYQLPVESKVSLKIFDVLGREISVLVNDVQGDGYKELEWNATSNPSGLYFLELKAVDINDATNVFTQVRKLVVSK
jgi:hypothetical protein